MTIDLRTYRTAQGNWYFGDDAGMLYITLRGSDGVFKTLKVSQEVASEFSKLANPRHLTWDEAHAWIAEHSKPKEWPQPEDLVHTIGSDGFMYGNFARDSANHIVFHNAFRTNEFAESLRDAVGQLFEVAQIAERHGITLFWRPVGLGGICSEGEFEAMQAFEAEMKLREAKNATK